MNAISLPPELEHIIERLEAGGYEAYAVGGCVRDCLSGRTPGDWDVCSSARPEDITRCFEGLRVIETGIKHGTLTVLLNGNSYEITTFRRDGAYSDYRRPDSVSFTSSIRDDLARRDFTINAMAYSPKTGLVDPFGGQRDLKAGIIRCVGKAASRFREDALRILRALRFASTLGFDIETETSASLLENRSLLGYIAAERISAELNKLLCGANAESVMLEYTDVMATVIPEIKEMIGFRQNSRYHHLDVWRHTLRAVGASPPVLILRLTLLLHDIAKPRCYSEDEGVGHFYGHTRTGSEMAKEILHRLRYDSETVRKISCLVLHHDSDVKVKNVKRWLNRIGAELFNLLLEVKRADSYAHAPQFLEDKLSLLAAVQAYANEIIADNQCFSLKNLAVNGSDLLALGIPEGPMLGAVLNGLLDLVIDDALVNDKESLLAAAYGLYSRLQE